MGAYQLVGAQDKRFEHKNLPSHFIETMQITGKDNINHVDSLAGYSINIPLWWNVFETPSRNILSGILPKVKGIHNAIAYKVSVKSEFQDFQEYKNKIIADDSVGSHPSWSKDHTLLKKERIEEFEHLGEGYYVEMDWQGLTYCCCYILLETPKTYLWIDFTATPETYETNLEKFRKLLKSTSIH